MVFTAWKNLKKNSKLYHINKAKNRWKLKHPGLA